MALENYTSSKNRPFKFFYTYDLFMTKKVSASSENASYTIGDDPTVHTGDPEILWDHYVVIRDRELIWTRGRFFDKGRNLEKLSKISKNAHPSHKLDKAIVTIVDEDGRSYMDTAGIINIYNQHNIMPSLSIVPKFLEDKEGKNSDGSAFPVISVERLLQLICMGCDIVNHSYSHDSSIYKADATISAVEADLELASKWFASNGIVTNCFSYPYDIKSDNIVKAVRRYEEHAIYADGTTVSNGIYSDHMSFNKIYLNDTNIASVKSAINDAILNRTWIIIATHSCNDTNSNAIYGQLSASTIDEILTYIEGKGTDAIEYMQMTDALQCRASEFNVGTSGNLEFKVYKNGKVDINLSAASQANIDFANNSESYKDLMMKHVAAELSNYASLALEDGSLLETEKYEKIDVTGLGTFIISEKTIEFEFCDETKFKQPMLSYVQQNADFSSMNETFRNGTKSFIESNVDFSSMSDAFKAALMEYVVANWPAEDGSIFLMADTKPEPSASV